MFKRAVLPCPVCHGEMLKFRFGRFDKTKTLICQNIECGFVFDHGTRVG